MNRWNNSRERYGEIGEPISTAECNALRLLDLDGWTVGQIRLAFGFKTDNITKKHINAVCEHPHRIKTSQLMPIIDKLNNDRKDKRRNENFIYNNPHVFSDVVCAAANILHNDGWSISLLEMIFEIGSAMSHHIDDECSHKDLTHLVKLKEKNKNDTKR